MTEEIPHESTPAPPDATESTGDAALDERLSRPAIEFTKGIDTAQVWMSAFLILVLGVLVYSNAIRIPFQPEDQRWITGNDALHSLPTFPAALDKESPRTLTFLTFALNWLAAPGSAPAFHVVNVLIHLANGVLLFLLCRALLPDAAPVLAMAGGLILVTQPLAAGTVNPIMGRSGMLATALILCSALWFLRATRSSEHMVVDYRWIAVSVIVFVLAWLADTTACVFPLFLLILDCAKHGRDGFRKHWTAHMPYWGAVGLLIVARWAAGGAVLSGNGALGAPLAVMVTLQPLVLFVLLIGSGGRPVAGILGFVVILGLLMLSARGLSLNDRSLAYLLLTGCALGVPWAFSQIRHTGVRTGFGLVVAASVLASAGTTYALNFTWQDPVQFWREAAQKMAHSAEAWGNLGRAYLDLAKRTESKDAALQTFRKAEESLRNALGAAPNDADAAADLGESLMYQGRSDEALSTLLGALREDYAHRAATLDLARLFDAKASQSDSQEGRIHAVEYYARAEALKPLTGDDLQQYAMLVVAAGDLDRAAPLLERAVAGNDQAPLAPVLKNVYATLKRVRDMEQQSATMLAKNPSDPTAQKMQAQILALRGQNLQAEYALEKLVRDGVQDFAVWILLGFVKAKMNATEHFAAEYPKSPPKPAEAESAWMELAQTCAGAGLWDGAQAYLQTKPAEAETGRSGWVALADVALRLRQPRRAYDYLHQATEKTPTDPTPWLRLCDLALAGKDTSAAAQNLGEAETRGAPADEIAKRKERLGPAAPNPAVPERTIIH